MNAPLNIRKATPADIDLLLPLFRAYQEHYGTLTSATEAQTREFLDGLIGQPNAGFVLLAWQGTALVGFAAVYFTVSGLIAQRLAHLGDLYVEPAFRKNGIGTQLFEAAAEQARSCGIGSMRWLSLSANNEVNAWYTKRVKAIGTFELYLLPTAKPPGSGSAER